MAPRCPLHCGRHLFVLQAQVASFPFTLGVGLVGMLFTLPMMQRPFTVALVQMLARF